MAETLRDKVAETSPADVDVDYIGGVCGCPGWYSATKDAPVLCKKGEPIGDCDKCWSQEWKEEYAK